MRQLDNYSCFACCCFCYLRLTPLITALDPTFIIVCASELQLACNCDMGSAYLTCSREQLGNHKFWGKAIHDNIILGSNQNIWLRLLFLLSMSFCPPAIVSHHSRWSCCNAMIDSIQRCDGRTGSQFKIHREKTHPLYLSAKPCDEAYK